MMKGATPLKCSKDIMLGQKKKNKDFLYKILDDSSKYHLTIKQITI
jgi:hypothetical protein